MEELGGNEVIRIGICLRSKRLGDGNEGNGIVRSGQKWWLKKVT